MEYYEVLNSQHGAKISLALDFHRLRYTLIARKLVTVLTESGVIS